MRPLLTRTLPTTQNRFFFFFFTTQTWNFLQIKLTENKKTKSRHWISCIKKNSFLFLKIFKKYLNKDWMSIQMPVAWRRRVGRASLSCPVLLICSACSVCVCGWESGGVEKAVMGVTATPLGMWTDWPPSHTSAAQPHARTPNTHTPAYVWLQLGVSLSNAGNLCLPRHWQI